MRRDILLLKQLEVEVIVGVLPHERTHQQTIFFDLEFSIDVYKAAATDALSAAIDYSQLHKKLIDFVHSTRYQLVETLAENAAKFLIQEFKLTWLRLSLFKPTALPNVKAVGVVIERP